MADISEHENRLIEVLDRQTACDTLTALVSAMRAEPTKIPLADTAIGLDSNVFLRLSRHSRGADIIDYISATHTAPLILPGQAIQEFWNNLHVIETVDNALQKKFDPFKAEFDKVDERFGDYFGDHVAKIDELIKKFSAEYGHVYDEGLVRKTLAVLEVFQKRALVPYARRTRFHEIATHRKSTKTPPGFKDDGDGDFFIWVDLLTGLQKAQADQSKFSQVVLVTDDRKLDWSRGGKAHPILVAEVNALLNVPFEIWTIDNLIEAIDKAT